MPMIGFGIALDEPQQVATGGGGPTNALTDESSNLLTDESGNFLVQES